MCDKVKYPGTIMFDMGNNCFIDSSIQLRIFVRLFENFNAWHCTRCTRKSIKYLKRMLFVMFITSTILGRDSTQSWMVISELRNFYASVGNFNVWNCTQCDEIKYPENKVFCV